MNATAPGVSRRFLTPAWWLAILMLAGLLLFALLSEARRRFGLFDYGMWFMDSYAVLASNDARLAGADPFQPNPLDKFNRPHSYSGWWFLLGEAGFTREDNFLVGGTWVLAFAGSAWLFLRPATGLMAGLGAAMFLSPAVLLAVLRANNDLVVFALLAGALCLQGGDERWRRVVLLLAVLLATGLKFYPVIAGAACLALGPRRRAWFWTGLTLLAAGAVFLTVRADFARATFPVPTNLYTFGAPILLRDLGFSGSVLPGLGLMGVGAVACGMLGWSPRLDDHAGDPRARLAFATGALLLTGCFAAGISYSYRLIFVLLLLPWLVERRAERRARVLLALLFALLWLDGLYCVVTNSVFGPMPEAQLDRWQLVWRGWTQPLAWAAMALLGGSLAGLLLSALRKRSRAGTAGP